MSRIQRALCLVFGVVLSFAAPATAQVPEEALRFEAGNERLAQARSIEGGPLTRPLQRGPAVRQSAIVQGDQLKASPGFVLEVQGDNQVSARRAAGGLGADGAWTCSCTGGGGSCDATSSGDIAVCHKSSSAPCLGTCGWDVNVTGGGLLAQ
jgi:hypothetical protein